MNRIATDILGELPITKNGNRYILVVSDFFTKWTERLFKFIFINYLASVHVYAHYYAEF